MPQVFIKCPQTGKDAFTGMSLPRGNILRNNTTSCPHCGQSHTWSGEDAYFVTPNGDEPYVAPPPKP